MILQVADLTFEALGLPDWAYRFTVILSAVGLPVTAVSAWIFDLRDGRLQRTGPVEAGAAGERASPVVAFAVVGGTVALAALLTLVVWRGPSGADDVNADIIAVAPFRVATSDPGLSYLREGALDLLAAKLTDQPRVLDPRTLVSAWRGKAGEISADLPADDVVMLAGSLGAGRVLLGSFIGAPEGLTLTASLLDVPDGNVVVETSIEGPVDSLTTMIDGLAAQLLGVTGGASVESLTSTSVPAVRHYLEGRSLYRQGDFPGAADAYLRALDEDSTFASAAIALYTTTQMRVNALDAGLYAEIAWRNRDRLSDADRLTLTAALGVNYPEWATLQEEIDFLREAVQRYPDRAELWYFYADELFHRGNQVGLRDDLMQAQAGFERAVELDPGFYNARLHLAWTYRELGDSRWRDVTPVQRSLAAIPTAVDLGGLNDSTALQRILDTPDSVLARSPAESLLGIGPQAAGPLVAEAGPKLTRVVDLTQRVALGQQLTDEERAIAEDFRFSYLAALRRTDEVIRFSRAMAPVSQDAGADHALRMLSAAVLWELDLPAEVVEDAERVLTEQVAGEGLAPPTGSSGEIRTRCLLGLRAVEAGDVPTARALRDAMTPDAPYAEIRRDLTLSSRNTCGLLLSASMAESAVAPGSGPTDPLLEAAAWLDEGPAGSNTRLFANLVVARMMERAGDLEAAFSHGRRVNRTTRALALVRPFWEVQQRAVAAQGRTVDARVLQSRIDALAWPPEGD